MGDNRGGKIGYAGYVDIPINMELKMKANKKMELKCFDYETSDHRCIKVDIDDIVSDSESNIVGIRERKFVCIVKAGNVRRTIEIRYHVANQTWRICRFL